MAVVPHFADRTDAGRRLAELVRGPPGPALVLGLARGGIPVAAEVAVALDAPLDALVVRKVGHPRQPEYALGAVSEDGIVLPGDLEPSAAERELERARAQAQALRGAGRGPAPTAGMTAVLVDDGLATGRTMAVAVETVRRRGAAGVVVAVPVAAGPAFRDFAASIATVAVAVVEPPEFLAVGQFYADFAQVSDREAAALLSAPHA